MAICLMSVQEEHYHIAQLGEVYQVDFTVRVERRLFNS